MTKIKIEDLPMLESLSNAELKGVLGGSTMGGSPTIDPNTPLAGSSGAGGTTGSGGNPTGGSGGSGLTESTNPHGLPGTGLT